MKDVFIYNKEVSPGRWLAATGVAPYFCFESDSREHALEIAKRALRFFEANKDRLEAQVQTIREREKATSTFSNKDKVSASRRRYLTRECGLHSRDFNFVHARGKAKR
jgi:hypothetical protein